MNRKNRWDRDIFLPAAIVMIYILAVTLFDRFTVPFTADMIDEIALFAQLRRDMINILLMLPFVVSYYKDPRFMAHELKAIKKMSVWIITVPIWVCMILLLSFHWSLGRIYASFYYLAVVACGEEYVFRGFLYGKLRDRLSFTAATLVSGVIYGLAHGLFQFVVLQQPWYSVPSCLSAGVVGALLFNVIFDRAGTIIVPVLIHWILDFCGYLL